MPVLRDRLGAETWNALLGDSSQTSIDAGVTLTGEKHRDMVVLLLEGRLRAYLPMRNGRQVTARYLRSGQAVGLPAAVLSWGDWHAEAVVPSTVAVVPIERLQQLIGSDARALRTYAEELAYLAVDSVRMVAGASSESMMVRVAAHLLEIAAPTPDGRLVARITHQRLADSIGTAREVVTRVLQRLRSAGVVRTGAGSIEILDADRLMTAVREQEEQPEPQA